MSTLGRGGTHDQEHRPGQWVEFGFDPERLFTTRIGLFAADYPDREDRQQLYDELLRAVEPIPNVQAASLMSSLPGAGAGTTRIQLPGVVYNDDDDRPLVHFNTVTPSFFDLLDTQFVQGSNFSAAHTWEAGRVVVVNQSFQDRFWPGESALGRQFRPELSDTNPMDECDWRGTGPPHGGLYTRGTAWRQPGRILRAVGATRPGAS